MKTKEELDKLKDDVKSGIHGLLEEHIMVKTQEELKLLKEEVETLNKKLVELTEEDLEQVSGGGEGDLFDSGYEYPGYPGIWFIYDLSLGVYRMIDKLTGNEKIAQSAGDLEETAIELKNLR